jgi:hypothetical protein
MRASSFSSPMRAARGYKAQKMQPVLLQESDVEVSLFVHLIYLSHRIA